MHLAFTIPPPMSAAFLLRFRDPRKPDMLIRAVRVEVEQYSDDPAVLLLGEDGTTVFSAKVRDLAAWGRHDAVIPES